MKIKPELPSVLLIEDDEVDIKSMIRSFEKLEIKFPLLIARDGLEALNKLQGNAGVTKYDIQPKLILLDIKMPKMNGIDFVKAVRKDPSLSSILIFVLTTSNNERDIETLYNLKISGYFLKPVEFTESIKIIQVLKDFWCRLRLPQTA